MTRAGLPLPMGDDSAISERLAQSSADVFGMSQPVGGAGQDLDVVRINTTLVAALMVRFRPDRNRAAQQLVHHAMGHPRAPIYRYHAVPVRIFRPGPVPTIRFPVDGIAIGGKAKHAAVAVDKANRMALDPPVLSRRVSCDGGRGTASALAQPGRVRRRGQRRGHTIAATNGTSTSGGMLSVHRRPPSLVPLPGCLTAARGFFVAPILPFCAYDPEEYR